MRQLTLPANDTRHFAPSRGCPASPAAGRGTFGRPDCVVLKPGSKAPEGHSGSMPRATMTRETML